MLKSRLNSRQHIDEKLASQNNSVDRLPEPGALQPVDYNVSSAFELAVSTHQGLDKLILEQLRPSVGNKSILAPSNYKKLLANATETLFRINQQSGDSVCGYCGEMLKIEVFQIEFIHSKRNL